MNYRITSWELLGRLAFATRCRRAFPISLFLLASFGCRPAPTKVPLPKAEAAPESFSEDGRTNESPASAIDVSPDLSHEDLDGTVWIQTSAEYGAITRQTYRAAEQQLQRALADSSWTAWPPQAESLNENHPLPPAVIVDVDETVLDNSGFQARLILSEQDFDPGRWTDWVHERVARAVPGAREFLTRCRQADVAVFFVTNRTHDVEASTKANLESLGLRDAATDDNILSKREREAWVEAGSDKTPRRDFVARSHRILLIIGDDLNDFVYTGFKPTPKIRRDAADEYTEYWGVKWFVLPNPSYGGWERALFGFDDRLPRDEKLKKKRQHLRWSE